MCISWILTCLFKLLCFIWISWRFWGQFSELWSETVACSGDVCKRFGFGRISFGFVEYIDCFECFRDDFGVCCGDPGFLRSENPYLCLLGYLVFEFNVTNIWVGLIVACRPLGGCPFFGRAGCWMLSKFLFTYNFFNTTCFYSVILYIIISLTMSFICPFFFLAIYHISKMYRNIKDFTSAIHHLLFLLLLIH